jgi:hypothetical protein
MWAGKRWLQLTGAILNHSASGDRSRETPPAATLQHTGHVANAERNHLASKTRGSVGDDGRDRRRAWRFEGVHGRVKICL